MSVTKVQHIMKELFDASVTPLSVRTFLTWPSFDDIVDGMN